MTIEDDPPRSASSAPPPAGVDGAGSSSPLEMPRVIAGLIGVRAGDALIVEGGATRAVIRGRSVDVVERLFRKLDGTLTVGELTRTTGLSPRSVEQVVALLWSRGLLEDAASQPKPPQSPADAFLSRLSGTTSAIGGHAAARRRLQNALMGVYGPPGLAEVLVEFLALDGISARRESASPSTPPASDLTFVTVIEGPDSDMEERLSLEASLASRALPTLRVFVGPSVLELGPVYRAGSSGCYRCLLRTRRAPAGTRGDHGDATAGLGMALAAAEIGRILTGVGDTVYWWGFVRLDLPDCAGRVVAVPRRADCATCGGKAVPYPAEPIEIAHAYDQLTDAGAKRSLNPVTAGEYWVAPDLLQRQRRPSPTLPRIEIPAESEIGKATSPFSIGARPSVDAPLTAALLAGVLRRSGGFRQPKGTTAARWIPSAGNLGSAQVFLATSGVSGLQDGVFLYEPFEDALAVILPPHGMSHGDCLEALGAPRTAPPHGRAVIAFVSALDRLAKKYEHRALQLAGLDAGCALTCCVAAAHGYGLVARVVTDFSPSIVANIFHTSPTIELPTALCVVAPREER